MKNVRLPLVRMREDILDAPILRIVGIDDGSGEVFGVCLYKAEKKVDANYDSILKHEGTH